MTVHLRLSYLSLIQSFCRLYRRQSLVDTDIADKKYYLDVDFRVKGAEKSISIGFFESISRFFSSFRTSFFQRPF